MAIREGRWDCPSCGSTAIYGRHVDCPGCGRPRPAGVRFYLADGEPAITSAAQLAEAKAGADWICEHCAASTRAAQDTCGGCGAPRGTSPTQSVVTYSLGAVPRSGDAAAAASPKAAGGFRPSWICNHCPTTNAAEVWACTACGKARGSVPPRPEPGAEPARMAAAAVDADDPAVDADESTDTSSRRVGILAGVVFTGVLVLLGFLGIANHEPAPAYDDGPLPVYEAPPEVQPVVVEAMRWRRDVAVEERRLVPGAGWSLPDGALVLSSERRGRGQERVVERYVTTTSTRWVTDRVADGYDTRTREVSERVRTGTRTYTCGSRDLGNGYFEDVECTEPTYETRTRTETYQEPRYRTERWLDTITTQEPVYRTVPVHGTWYTWNMPVWTPRIYRAEGDTTPPGWPGVAFGPDRRLRSRSEQYFVTLRRPDGTYEDEIEIPLEQWSRYRVGQRLAFRWEQGERILLPPDSLPACISWHAGQGTVAPDSLGCSPRPGSPRTDSVQPDSAPPDSIQ
jgi:hypothetical protein